MHAHEYLKKKQKLLRIAKIVPKHGKILSIKCPFSLDILKTKTPLNKPNSDLCRI